MAGRPRAEALAAPEIAPEHPLQAAWHAWKLAYLEPDGRVVDAFQNDASHSEGQGYGMTLATFFGDARAFELMRGWTEARLAVRDDALLAWRWTPGPEGASLDRNNASDGDILYAWALSRAAILFDRPELMDRARGLADALAASCVVRRPDASQRLLLLPAAYGFVEGDSVITNPSYLIPRAMRDLADSVGSAYLARCLEDGLALLEELAATGLAPDWVKITPAGLARAEELSFASGYDAMRVGLYLTWSGFDDHPAVLRQAAAYRAAVGAGDAITTATILDAQTAAVLERSPHAGYAALSGLLLCVDGEGVGASIPPFTTNQPYYPATLHLLSLVAQVERHPRCLPI
jgi:endoglucanase